MALLNIDIAPTPATPLEPAPAPKPRDGASRKEFDDHLDRACRSGDSDAKPAKPTEVNRPSPSGRAKANDDRAENDTVNKARPAKKAEDQPADDATVGANAATATAVVVTSAKEAALAEETDSKAEKPEAETVAAAEDASPKDSESSAAQVVEATLVAQAAATVENAATSTNSEVAEPLTEAVHEVDPKDIAKPIATHLKAKGQDITLLAGKAHESKADTAASDELSAPTTPDDAVAGQLEVAPVAETKPEAPPASGELHDETSTTQPVGVKSATESFLTPVVAAVAPTLPASGDTSGGAIAEKTHDRVESTPADASAKSPSSPNVEPAPNHPPRLPVTLNPHGKAGGDESGGLTEVQRVRFVQRVARAFQTIGDSGNPLRLRLSPPELGSLRLEITMNQGQMTARVEAETEAARTVLLDNLPALRERLAQQDIKIARFDVDLFGQTSGGLPQNQDRGQAFDDGSAASGSRRRSSGAGERAPVEGSPRAAATPADGRLNVII